jgi:FkbM family methyltransferase
MIKKLVKNILGSIGIQLVLKKNIPSPIESLLPQFSTDWHPTLRKSANLIKRLLSIPNVKLWQENNQLFFKCHEIKIEVETNEDFYILNEVFFEGDYNLFFPEKYVLIDIGMNVGITSLFFASKPEVVKVFAYEPVEPTLRQAKMNLDRNLNFSHKITPHAFGLSDHDHSLKINYTYEWKGSIGVNQLSDAKKKNSNLTTISIELRDVAVEIKKIKALFLNIPIVIKVDCEGSEYAIIQRLVQENLLREVNIYMIEWHEKGPAPLQIEFEKNGFSCLSKSPHGNSIGMLYAFK